MMSGAISEELETMVFDREELLAALGSAGDDDLEELLPSLDERPTNPLPFDAEERTVPSAPAFRAEVAELSEEERFLATLPLATRAVLEAARTPVAAWPTRPRVPFAVARPIPSPRSTRG